MMRLLGGALVALVVGCASSKEGARADDATAEPLAAKETAEKPAVPPTPAPTPPGALPVGPVATAPAPVEAGQLPRATGTVQVKGGEVLALQGASVHVVRVVFENQPCPKGVQCVHSGIIKTVVLAVERGGSREERVIAEGAAGPLNGVMLRVLKVEAGPVATVEASLPLAAAPR